MWGTRLTLPFSPRSSFELAATVVRVTREEQALDEVDLACLAGQATISICKRRGTLCYRSCQGKNTQEATLKMLVV